MSSPSSSTDPVTSLLWDCSFPCQAIIQNRNTGQATRASPSGSCFFSVHRFGYLSFSIRVILEHFFDKNQPLAQIVGSNNARFWFSVELPSGTAVTEIEDDPPPGATSLQVPQNGIKGRKKSSTMRLNDPTTSFFDRAGGGATAPSLAATAGAAGQNRYIPVSMCKPFCVLIDELRCQLQSEADELAKLRATYNAAAAGSATPSSGINSATNRTLPPTSASPLAQAVSEAAHGKQRSTTKVQLDLPLRLVLNIDDNPPSNVLSLGCQSFEREATMLLRQYQKMNCVHMFGSVKPFLMLDPSSTQTLEDGCKKGDADGFIQARAQIVSKGTLEMSRNREGGGAANPYSPREAADGSVFANIEERQTTTTSTNSGSIAMPVTSSSSPTGGSTKGDGGSKMTTAAPCIFCFHINGRGMAFRRIPQDSPLARLGDVLKAYVVTFSGLTDGQIMADEPAPRAMGRVFLCGIEPSMCLPVDVICSTMSCSDLAVHVVIDTRSSPLVISSTDLSFSSSVLASEAALKSSMNGSGLLAAVDPSHNPEAIVRAKPHSLAHSGSMSIAESFYGAPSL